MNSNISAPFFKLENLLEILGKTHLRRNWAWGEKNGEVCFAIVDFDLLKARCYVHLDGDMKVKVEFLNLKIFLKFLFFFTLRVLIYLHIYTFT